MKSPYRMTKINGKSRLMHRAIMERHIGRKLSRFELVHHKNGNKKDNNIDNLEVVNPKEHASVHNMQKYPIEKNCEVCGKKYIPKPTKRKISKTCSRECRYKLLSLINCNPNAKNSMYRENAYPCQKAKRITSSVCGGGVYQGI